MTTTITTMDVDHDAATPQDEPYLWTPPADAETERLPLGDQRVFAAIDNSGSTAASDMGATVLEAQRHVLAACGGAFERRTVLWNGGSLAACSDVASAHEQRWHSGGGTDPRVIFDQFGELQAANVFALFTDGQIPGHLVPQVFALASRALAHATLVCVVTVIGNRQQRVTNVCDLSVLAPFRDACRDVVICLALVEESGLVPHVTATTNVRVLATKGAFAARWPSKEIVAGVTKIAALQPVRPRELVAEATLVRARPPTGFVPLNDAYVHLERFIERAPDAPLLADPVPLVQAAKSANLLAALRRRYQRAKSAALAVARRQAEQELASGEEESETDLMIKAHYGGDEACEKLRALRAHRAANAAALNERYRELARDVVTAIERGQAVLNEASATGFGADATTRLTNRARAAVRVDVAALEQERFDDAEALAGECSICCEACGPGTGHVLVLRVRRLPRATALRNVERNDPATGARTLADAIQTMPLAFGSAPHNQVLLPDEPMCAECARVYDQSVLTREDVACAVPCISLRTSAANRKAFAHALAAALADGVVMPVWHQLYAAVLDHALNTLGFVDAAHPEMRRAVLFQLNELLHHTHTNATLQEGMARSVPLVEAVANVVSGAVACVSAPATPYVHHYFAEGVARMLCLLKRSSRIAMTSDGRVTLHRALVAAAVSAYLARLKDDVGKRKAAAARRDFLARAFRTRHGVPVAESARLVSLADVRTLVPANVLGAIEEYCAIYNTTLADFVQLPALTRAWAALANLEARLAPDAFLARLATDPATNAVLAAPQHVAAEEVIALLNEPFRRQAVDAAHTADVPFATPFGPSKLACACGYRFYVGAPVPDYDDIEVARKRRAAHFSAVYHANASGNPSEQSSHWNLHVAVQRTFDLTRSDAENTASAIEYVLTTDRRGNIFAAELEAATAAAVRSFRPHAARWRELTKDAVGHTTFETMLRYELAAQ